MASRDKVDVDMFHKSIQYALEKLGKSKSGFERTVVSKFKRKRRVGSGNELVDYSRAPCLGADQKARGLWERDCERRRGTSDFLLLITSDLQLQNLEHRSSTCNLFPRKCRESNLIKPESYKRLFLRIIA